MAKRLFLIDGNAFCYRAYYAIKHLRTSYGQPTNAVYGFISMFNKIIANEKPDFVAVSFDLKGPTFRHKKFNAYKIQRKPMPDELVSQMPLIKEVLTAYNIPIFEKKGFEADDVIATIATKAAANKLDVYIVTTDKDMLQIVGDKISIYSPTKEGLICDKAWVKKKYGFTPEKITEFMALAGDSSDNIPGVPGIGAKTALKLIKQFGSLDKIFTNKDKLMPESVRKRITEFRDQALLSRELATVSLDVPLKIDIESLKLREPDNQKLIEMFKKLEFKRLLKQILEESPETKKSNFNYKIISSSGKDINSLLKRLSSSKEFAFDIDTGNSDSASMVAEIKGIAFCLGKTDSVYLKIDSKSDMLNELQDIFESKKIKKIIHDAKYKKIALSNYGINLQGISFDIMIASYLINSANPSKSITDIALDYLKHGAVILSFDQESDNSCHNAVLAFKLKSVLEEVLKDKGLTQLNNEIELPLASILADMELSGVKIDVKFLKKMSKEVGRELTKLISQIYEIAEVEFNINSPKQLSGILFEKLNLPVFKRTKTGPSTDIQVLERLASLHALPDKVLKYRKLAKIKSTYVDSLPALVNPKTGKLHTTFNQTATLTGRLSSSSPNLQNIPIKAGLGRQIRKAFIPGKSNNIFLSVDYSQIELRILAHLSKDKVLISAFNRGEDIHRKTAAIIFDVKEKDVSKLMRENAKTVNFSIIYGISPFALAKELGVSTEEAKRFISAYFKRYPKVNEYIESQINNAKKNGFVVTLLGRRRYIPEMNSSDVHLRQFAERVAANAPIQGTASDLIKLAMIEISNKLTLEGFNAKMVIQIHDELLFEVSGNQCNKVALLIKDAMENVLKLDAPLKATVKKGDNWLDMPEI